MKNINSFDINISAIISNKYYSYSDQKSNDVMKFPLLKSLDKSSHTSQITKHLSAINLEGYTIIIIQKWWYAV